MPSMASELAQVGYAHYDLGKQFCGETYTSDFQQLNDAFDDLPADPYAIGSGRYRRYARGLMLPWSGQFSWIPATPDQQRDGVNGYYQGDHNPEYAGVVRRLAAITEPVRENRLLRDVIMFDFAQTRWDETSSVWPLHVGVHLIKLSVDDDCQQAISSPNELHQDGEPFVFVHLVYRRNALGGDNLIAPPKYRGMQPQDVPPEDRLAEFELSEPLESYGITDCLVSHYVGPIRRGTSEEPGERAVILTDFVPMRQHI